MTDQSSTTRPPKIVVITPVFNETEALPAYERRVEDVLLSCSEYEFHVLLVDDGSHDHSWAMIREISQRNPRFQGIRLSRNYGAHTALSAGFMHAEGDALATLACDLQDSPETVLRFAEQWRGGTRIVWGRRRTRDDAFWRVWTSRLFHKLLRRFAMPPGSRFTTGSFFLADRQVVECFRQFQEHNRITFALVAWTGFEQSVVDYDRQRRIAGTSGWTFRKMIKTMYDAFVGFSFMPIRLITLAGVGSFFVSMLLAAYLLIAWLSGARVPGWTSQMLTMAVFFGVQFLLMGVMGEYLYRIYMEAVRRPLFFISDATADRADRQESWTEPKQSQAEACDAEHSHVAP